MSVCLRIRHGTPGMVGRDGGDATVGQVGHVVELGHVDAAGGGEAEEHLVAGRAPLQAGAALGLPLAHDLGDREHDLLAVTEHGGVDEVGHRLGVEGGVTAGEHDRVGLGPVDGVQRDAGQVDRGQQVRVAQLGREGHAQQVEGADRAVLVDGELRDPVRPHLLLEVRPHRVGALGQDPVALVEDLVEDLDALVGQADLVGVGVHQRPAHLGALPVLQRRVELTADVLDRLLHRGQHRLQEGEDGRGCRRGGGGRRHGGEPRGRGR